MGARFHAFMSMLVTVTVSTRGFSEGWILSKDCGCPKLQDPENGHVVVHGNTAWYTCDNYYTLIGDSTRTCSCCRWWSSVPECVSVCPALVNNSITLGLPISYVDSASAGLAAVLTCPKGYKLVGLDDGTVDCSDVHINSNPTCREECPDLPDPPHGTVRIFDDIAAYECEIGFRIIGSARRRCSDGVWTGTAPECSESENVNTIGDLNGINPDIILSEFGMTEVLGPRLLLPNCRVTATFQYRARSARGAIIVRARLLNARDGNSELAQAIAVLPTDMENTQTSCILLDCSQSGPEGGIVGVVVLTPELAIRETLAITSVRFDPNQRCEVDFKAGPCPVVESVTATNDMCKSACLTDSDCEGNRSRCCFNGCGLSCEVTTPNTTDLIACESLPCQNGGTCEVVFFGYICECTEGFTGINCEYREDPGRRRRSAEGTLVGDCDNTTESGDCGYRNSGCSVQPWALTIADDGDDEGMDDELAPLQYERPTEDCHFHVCVPCLLQSGFNVTSVSTAFPTGRRRRAFNPNGKAFCMEGGKGFPKFGEYFTNDIQLFESKTMLDDTELFSFEYNMRSEGIHHLMIYAKCKSLSRHIHVGLGKTVFDIAHFDQTVGKSGRVCVSLCPYISDVSGFSATTCSYFQIYIQAIGIGRKVCIEDLRFHPRTEHSKDSSYCPEIANEKNC